MTRRTTDSQSIERSLRRYRSSLAVSGMGVMLFGAWSLLRTAMLMAFGLDQSTEAAMEGLSGDLLVVAYGFTAVMLAIDLALRFYVGLSARAESRGKRAGNLYVIIATMFAIVSLVGIVSYIILFSQLLFSQLEGAIDSIIVSFLVDLTALSAMIEVVYSSLRVRRLTRKQEALCS